MIKIADKVAKLKPLILGKVVGDATTRKFSFATEGKVFVGLSVVVNNGDGRTLGVIRDIRSSNEYLQPGTARQMLQRKNDKTFSEKTINFCECDIVMGIKDNMADICRMPPSLGKEVFMIQKIKLTYEMSEE